MFKHNPGIGRGKAAGLGAEVKEDGIRLPMAQCMDGSLVDARDKEGSGATRAEAVGFDAVRRDVGDMVDGGSGAAKFGGDVPCGDIVWPASGVEVVV